MPPVVFGNSWPESSRTAATIEVPANSGDSLVLQVPGRACVNTQRLFRQALVAIDPLKADSQYLAAAMALLMRLRSTSGSDSKVLTAKRPK
jgi:hypothetical protein